MMEPPYSHGSEGSPLARIINRVGSPLLRAGIPLVNLSKDSLLKSARRRTGLSEPGRYFSREGFQILLQSLEKNANLHILGRRGIRRECLRLLCNNLQIQDDLKHHPEIVKGPIRRPVFIVGLPRTGTTLLHNLLACDPSARAPLMWELYHPSPPPTTETRTSDPRIAIAEKRVRRLLRVAPHLALIHPMDPEGPDECFHLFKNSFMSPAFMLIANVIPYMEWLLAQEMTPAYRYYRQQLQLLQWRCPGEYWILKSPSHLPFLDSLFAVFPDACIIQTHRDPLRVVPSFCSLVLTGWQMSSNRVDVNNVGRQCLNILKIFLDRSMAVREPGRTDQVFDLQYTDLVLDPIAAVHRIYNHFGLNVGSHMEKRMGRYLAETRRYRNGRHEYSLGAFGLNKEEIGGMYSDYIKNFSIEME
jgi:hypothetical protein